MRVAFYHKYSSLIIKATTDWGDQIGFSANRLDGPSIDKRARKICERRLRQETENALP